MSLVKCKVCGHDISSTADKCPSCGHDFRIRRGVIGCGMLLVLFGFAWAGFEFACSRAFPDAQASPASDSFSAEDQMASLDVAAGSHNTRQTGEFKIVLDTLEKYCLDERRDIALLLADSWRDSLGKRGSLLKWSQSVVVQARNQHNLLEKQGSLWARKSCAIPIDSLIFFSRNTQ